MIKIEIEALPRFDQVSRPAKQKNSYFRGRVFRQEEIDPSM